jgi:hypothetical protein
VKIPIAPTRLIREGSYRHETAVGVERMPERFVRLGIGRHERQSRALSLVRQYVSHGTSEVEAAFEPIGVAQELELTATLDDRVVVSMLVGFRRSAFRSCQGSPRER